MSGTFRNSSAQLTSERTLWLAVGVSLILHAAPLYFIGFKFPNASRAEQDQGLEIILVNSKSARKPTNAQALAQANLDGGGNTDDNRRSRTPLPPSEKQQRGSELEQAEKRLQSLEAQQQRLLVQTRSKGTLAQRTGDDAQPEPTRSVSGHDLANSALEMARLEGEIAKDSDEYNKRPRKKFIGTRTDEYRFARYIEDWRLKVERVGTLNYPEEAKGKLYGVLVLSVTIKSDGTIEKVDINRSSGHRILDNAARRIVTMAGPYAAFPAEIRHDTDILVITRNWSFTSSNQLETKAR